MLDLNVWKMEKIHLHPAIQTHKYKCNGCMWLIARMCMRCHSFGHRLHYQQCRRQTIYALQIPFIESRWKSEFRWLSIATFDYQRAIFHSRIITWEDQKTAFLRNQLGLPWLTRLSPQSIHWTPEALGARTPSRSLWQPPRACYPTDDARGHADLNRALATQIIQRYALAPASANPSFAISAKARCLSTPVPLA
jgi:hypothetical protein